MSREIRRILILGVDRLNDAARKIATVHVRRYDSTAGSLNGVAKDASRADNEYKLKIGDDVYFAGKHPDVLIKAPETTEFKPKESTGRTTAGGHNERVAMGYVQDYPEYGEVLKGVTMKDPRWPASEGWVKMSQTMDDVEIHYAYNPNTREAADYKFKDRTEPGEK